MNLDAGEGKFTLGEFSDVNMKNVAVEMLENTERSRVVTIMSPCASRWNLKVCSRWESHIYSQKLIREDQEKGWLPLCVSSPKQGQRNKKGKVCHQKCQ